MCVCVCCSTQRGGCFPGGGEGAPSAKGWQRSTHSGQLGVSSLLGGGGGAERAPAGGGEIGEGVRAKQQGGRTAFALSFLLSFLPSFLPSLCRFLGKVVVEGEIWGQAYAHNKKEAKKRAAEDAIRKREGLMDYYVSYSGAGGCGGVRRGWYRVKGVWGKREGLMDHYVSFSGAGVVRRIVVGWGWCRVGEERDSWTTM